jgi:hypothetical protein
MASLEHFRLFSESLPVQDHFLAVLYCLSLNNIEVVGWERKNMEIVYHLRKDESSAAIKTWFNKDGIFNGKYMAIPAHTNNAEFYAEVEALLKTLPKVTINRNTAETIISQVLFDNEVAEKFPFTKVLFDDFIFLFEGTGIVIESIAHFAYKERYTFKRASEMATIDFEYGSKGFWGRVFAISSKTNSCELVKYIQSLLKTLQQESHAI